MLNRGAITTANLYVYGGQTFDISASDAVTNLTLSAGTSTLYSPVASLTLSNTSQATTTPAASVTGNVTLNTGSKLTMGAPLTLSGPLGVAQNSTLDIDGHNATVGAVTVSGGSIVNSGGAAAITGASYAVQSGLISANLSGSGVKLTKTTTALAILSGTNTYTGGTTVSGGTFGHRRPQRAGRQRVGDDCRRRAAGLGERRGHRRIARGLVADHFGRGCPQRGGDSGDDRRI